VGIIVSYYVINNSKLISEIEDKMNSNFDIESFLNQNKAKITSFSSFVKSWNPLYSLLGKISGNNLFDKLSDYKSSYEFDEYSKIFTNNEVNVLHGIFENVTGEEIKKAIKNDLFKIEISEEEGYHMEYIADEDSIYTEFIELKNAVDFAYNSNSQILQILMP